MHKKISKIMQGGDIALCTNIFVVETWLIKFMEICRRKCGVQPRTLLNVILTPNISWRNFHNFCNSYFKEHLEIESSFNFGCK